MVEWIVAAVVIVLGVVLLPWLLSGFGRGLPKGGGGGVGNALQEIDALFNPTRKHDVAVRSQPVKGRPGAGDPPDDGEEETRTP